MSSVITNIRQLFTYMMTRIHHLSRKGRDQFCSGWIHSRVGPNGVSRTSCIQLVSDHKNSYITSVCSHGYWYSVLQYGSMWATLPPETSWHFHINITVNVHLWICLYVVNLPASQISNQWQNQDQVHCAPTDHWHISFPVVDTILQLSSMCTEASFPLADHHTIR